VSRGLGDVYKRQAGRGIHPGTRRGRRRRPSPSGSPRYRRANSCGPRRTRRPAVSCRRLSTLPGGLKQGASRRPACMRGLSRSHKPASGSQTASGGGAEPVAPRNMQQDGQDERSGRVHHRAHCRGIHDPGAGDHRQCLVLIGPTAQRAGHGRIAAHCGLWARVLCACGKTEECQGGTDAIGGTYRSRNIKAAPSVFSRRRFPSIPLTKA